MYAKTAAEYLHAWCRATWPGEEVRQPGQAGRGALMASTMANGDMIDVFDHKGGGTHKYIPADKLTADLNEPPGAGVFSYWHMADDSYLLRTCRGPLAYWSGKAEDQAQWAR